MHRNEVATRADGENHRHGRVRLLIQAMIRVVDQRNESDIFRDDDLVIPTLKTLALGRPAIKEI